MPHVLAISAYIFGIVSCFAKEIGATVFGLMCALELCGAMTDVSRKPSRIKRRRKQKVDIDDGLIIQQRLRDSDKIMTLLVLWTQELRDGLEDTWKVIC